VLEKGRNRKESWISTYIPTARTMRGEKKKKKRGVLPPAFRAGIIRRGEEEVLF